MQNTQKLVPAVQPSTNMKGMQLKPALRGVGPTGSQPTSSASHHDDQPSADTASIDGWIRDLPTKFPDVNEGVMKDMMSLIARYFEQIRIAVEKHEGATSVPEVLEVLEMEKKFCLWADGDGDLDRRLNDDTTVKKLIVSDLAALVLVLSTGIGLFTSEYQRTLAGETNRVLEQASKVAHSHLRQSASCPPLDILIFCNSIKEIESRIDNLYTLLPSTRHLVEDFDETESRQAKEIGVDEHWSIPDDNINQVHRRLSQGFKHLRATFTPASKSLSTSHDAKNSRKPHSNPSKSSTEKWSGSAQPSSIPLLISDSNTHDSANNSTDTTTSDSPSGVEKSSTETTTSNSTRASSSCKKCRTIFSDPVGIECHSCPGNGIAYFCNGLLSRISARMSRGRVFEPEQHVRIWHRNGGYNKKSNIALTDTGTDESFIRRSIVEELELETKQIAPITLTPFNNQPFIVSERVQPIWRFHKGSWRHQEFAFFVLSEIPGDRDMVLGNIARKELGIDLRVSGALVAHEETQGLSTLTRQQQQRQRQLRDTTASQTKTRQDLEARHAKMVQKRNAAKAATSEKPSSTTPQKDASGLSSNQGR